MKPRVIAICGKGGTGKTTVSALIAKALYEETRQKVLIIDADPAGGLQMALGIKPKISLAEIKAETIRSIKKRKADRRDILLTLDYLMMKALTGLKNLAFLSLGRSEERGCYCSINRILRDSIEILSENFDITVIDGEAGIEQVNREVMSKAKLLILVSDTSVKGVRVAEAIQKVARKISSKTQAGLLLNRIRSEEELKKIKGQTGLEIIGWIPEENRIREFDARGISLLNLPVCQSYRKVIEALEKLKIL